MTEQTSATSFATCMINLKKGEGLIAARVRLIDEQTCGALQGARTATHCITTAKSNLKKKKKNQRNNKNVAAPQQNSTNVSVRGFIQVRVY